MLGKRLLSLRLRLAALGDDLDRLLVLLRRRRLRLSEIRIVEETKLSGIFEALALRSVDTPEVVVDLVLEPLDFMFERVRTLAEMEVLLLERLVPRQYLVTLTKHGREFYRITMPRQVLHARSKRSFSLRW